MSHVDAGFVYNIKFRRHARTLSMGELKFLRNAVLFSASNLINLIHKSIRLFVKAYVSI